MPNAEYVIIFLLGLIVVKLFEACLYLSRLVNGVARVLAFLDGQAERQQNEDDIKRVEEEELRHNLDQP